MFFNNKEIKKLKRRVSDLEISIGELFSEEKKILPEHHMKRPIYPIKVDYIDEKELSTLTSTKYIVTVVMPQSTPKPTRQTFRMTRSDVDDFLLMMPSTIGAHIIEIKCEDI